MFRLAKESRVLKVALSLLLSILVFFIYWQTYTFDFVSFDDNTYVWDNPHIQNGLSWQSFAWSFTTMRAYFWHPLTWISHILVYDFFDLNPGPHHLINVIFHSLNSIFLFHLFLQVTRSTWKSAFVAAIFAIHPLHVESVAWVSERKDVLAAFFWILTFWAYACFVQRNGFKRYFFVVLFYALSLLSKPSVVTLPFNLLLFDFWPLGRMNDENGKIHFDGIILRRLILEKIPLFIMAFSVAFITYTRGVAMPRNSFLLVTRASNAVVSYVFYLSKTFLPNHLSAFYPHVGPNLPASDVFAASIFLIIITVFVFRRVKTQSYLLFGWFWFFGTLIPNIGIVQVGGFSRADRYMYLPLVGLSVMVAWGVPKMVSSWRKRKQLLTVLSVWSVIALSAVSVKQVAYWRNSETLFRRAAAVTENNWLAHNSLGAELVIQERYDEAIEHFKTSLEIAPTHFKTHNNLGVALRSQGKFDEAIHHFERSLALKPNDENALRNVIETREYLLKIRGNKE
jgi:protein O-mannosyl-transferase